MFGPVCEAVIDMYQALPFASWVNHVAKITSPWCAKLMPHPASDPAGAFHHIPWKLRFAASPETSTTLTVVAVSPRLSVTVRRTLNRPALVGWTAAVTALADPRNPVTMPPPSTIFPLIRDDAAAARSNGTLRR